jgi:hypothetical protein
MSAASYNGDSSDSLIYSAASGRLSRSDALARSVTTDLHYDFLTFLAIAQHLNIDFLPITWQPALAKVGNGGTAEIRQALVNLQMSFAFKRLIPTQFAKSEDKIFQALIAEILVLGHPSIRSHPNIIRLEGICWDVDPEDEKVWPVLMFEKTQHGDLHTFMKRGVGVGLSFEDKLSLCADVAMAIMDMHSHRVLTDSIMGMRG